MDGDGILFTGRDSIALYHHLFLGKASIPEPYPEGGVDPAGGSELPCEAETVFDEPIPPSPKLYNLFLSTIEDVEEPGPSEAEFRGLPGEVIDIPFFVFLSGSAVARDLGGAMAWSFGLDLQVESLDLRSRRQHRMAEAPVERNHLKC